MLWKVGLGAIFLLVLAGLRRLYAWYAHRQFLLALVPMASKPHWLQGHAVKDITEELGSRIEMVKRCPRLFLLMVGPLPTVSLVHPETVAVVLRKLHPKNEQFYRLLRPLLGNGLITSSGKRWERDRHLLSRIFTIDMLRNYVPVYKRACTVMLDLWAARSPQSINATQYLPHLAFDIILQCAMGVNTGCQTDTGVDSAAMRYHRSVTNLLEQTSSRLCKILYHSDLIFFMSPEGRRYRRNLAESCAFSKSLIRDRREELKNKKPDSSHACTVHRDMLSALLTVRDGDGVGLSDEEIREQVDTFLFAGHDTTSATLQWAVHYLAQHPDVQERCREEIVRVLGDCGGLEGLQHMHIGLFQYVTQTVQEVLRISAVLPGIGRVLKQPTCIDGLKLPGNTFMHINMVGLNYNEQVWDDPTSFNPDRFSAERSAARDPYAFIPFGAGARSCIGKHFAMDEIRIVLIMMLLRFRISPDPDAATPIWGKNIVVHPYPHVSVYLTEI